MPQFKGQDIFDILGSVEDITIRIEELITGKERLQPDEVSGLKAFFLQRKDLYV